MSEELLGGADQGDLNEEPTTEPTPEPVAAPGVGTTPEQIHPDAQAVIGQSVLYVMPDRTDREALVLRINGDVAVLNVRVALNNDDQIQWQQYAAVPKGKARKPGTWREVEE